jgi:hypothetical protein
MNKNLTKIEACEVLGLVTYDVAIPQSFFDQLLSLAPDEHPLGHFVWCYDEAKLFGAPRPLTPRGIELLTKYNEVYKTQYPTNVRVIDVE